MDDHIERALRVQVERIEAIRPQIEGTPVDEEPPEAAIGRGVGAMREVGACKKRVEALSNEIVALEEWANKYGLPVYNRPRYEYGDLGEVGPVKFQGGVIWLRGYGCRICGHGFWTEADAKRVLPPGPRACPHCGEHSMVVAA